jgi:hypothetical protein
MPTSPIHETPQLTPSNERRPDSTALPRERSVGPLPAEMFAKLLCASASTAVLAMSTSPNMQWLVGAIAGGGLMLAYFTFEELRRVRRRLETLESLSRSGDA